ncbi:MAG: hypothetical protein ACXAC7_04960 [Candidatus Hodarchaeales archaeon]|jgi:hypothetical protein
MAIDSIVIDDYQSTIQFDNFINLLSGLLPEYDYVFPFIKDLFITWKFDTSLFLNYLSFLDDFFVVNNISTPNNIDLIALLFEFLLNQILDILTPLGYNSPLIPCSIVHNSFESCFIDFESIVEFLENNPQYMKDFSLLEAFYKAIFLTIA